MKTGYQWRFLPNDFPKWQLVYYRAANRYLRKWIELEEFDELLEKLRGKVRVRIGQNALSSLGIMDSQSIHWGNNRFLNGIDGNKKIKPQWNWHKNRANA